MFVRTAALLILVVNGNALAQSIITTVLGTDSVFPISSIPSLDAPLGGLGGLALDSSGNIYTTDVYRGLVLKISPDGRLILVAGNSIQGLSGDGGGALSASLNAPERVAIDSNGNLFIADTNNNRVRKVTPSGIITTLAGNGAAGFSGDGGAAINAALYEPAGLAVDSSGNVYIADSGNNRIRKVDPSGVITTVAGNGLPVYSGDGGAASRASLNFPNSVAVDASGNLYIADSGNNTIRKITTGGPFGATIMTVAGSGIFGYSGDGGKATAASLAYPTDAFLDASGNLFIADYSNSRIRKVTADGIIHTVAGNGALGYSGDGGSALQAALGDPFGVVVDASGTIFIADTFKTKIRVVDATGTITTILDNVPRSPLPTDLEPAAGQVQLFPDGLAWDKSGNLFISDCSNNRVRKLTSNGIVTVAGSGLQGYSGDSGSATAASLDCPRGLAFDASGNLVIADTYNYRIRKVAADGRISTIAGNGSASFSGDGVNATSAGLGLPLSIAFDAAGNLFISDFFGQRIRRVSTEGLISTVAGNGSQAYSGDGGLATKATLSDPNGVAVDAAGNLYIADSGNNVIRKVSASGIISTVAGTGQAGFGGDGVQATKTTLAYPTFVFPDNAGNLFVADRDNNRIRKVAADGTITTVAGNGFKAFLGDGGPAPNASLALPATAVMNPAGVLAIADTFNNRIREVLTTPPSAQVTPATLAFTAVSGGPPTAAQGIDVTSPLSGVAFTTSASGDSGASWLALSQSSGNTPSTIQVFVNPAQLSAGTYNATVTVTFPYASPSVQTVQITCSVQAPAAAHLATQTSSLTIPLLQGGSVGTAQLTVTNTGGGSLGFAAASSTFSGGSWLSLGQSSGTVSASQPVSLTVIANPMNLSPGTYTGSVLISSSATGEKVTIPVTLTVSPAQPQIVLSQTGLAFTIVAQGGIPLPQSFGILNAGTGSMTWSAQASTLSGGSWLSVSMASGTVNTPLQDVSFVDVIVDPTKLVTGTSSNFYGTIQVTASGAVNSPQFITVVLTVLPRGSNPGPEVRPTGLVFTGVEGGTSPGSQNVNVSNVAGMQQLTYGSSPTYVNGSNWLTYIPSSAVLDPASPTRIVVQPDFTSLAPGIYRGAITLALSDGSIRTVAILSVVAPGTAVAGAQSRPRQAPRAKCSPSFLQVQIANPSQSFTASLGQPVPMEAVVVDDCGTPLTPQRGGAAVLAAFGSGDPQLSMVHTQNGRWSGTWVPRNGSPGSSVRIAFTAFLSQGTQFFGGQAQLSVGLTGGVGAPVSESVRNSASFLDTGILAPGALISLFGSGLASAPSSGTVPLPIDLAGTEVTMGGQPLPLLYASDGQVNAQVPYGLAINTQLQLRVVRETLVSVPQSLTVAAAQPAIFTVDESGQGQGAIVNLQNLLVDATAPATAGDTVVIYCTGLGAVTPPVPEGVPAPSQPLSQTGGVSVSIGGQLAAVSFAGLSPGYAGLYQINAVVPSGIVTGNAVPVVISVAGQTSPINPPVTMAVK